MATVVNGNKVRLNNGQIVDAQTGGWYDSRQFWNGSLSEPGQIHPASNQPGAGQDVNPAVVAATNPAQGLAPGTNEAYIASQRQQRQQAGSATPATAGTTAGQLPATTPGAGAGAAGAGVGFTTPTPVDLSSLYQREFEAKGITEKEKQLADMEARKTEALAGINDNPYLSEATRVGRVAKIEQLHAERTANIRSQIATARADVETAINLATKQFDINSQAAQQAISTFNALLSSGALAGATGEDIAGITRSTGISSSMIQAAIAATAKKNLNTQVVSFDDGTNQGFVVVNQDTGDIISKQNIAASKPRESTVSEREAADLIQTRANLEADILARSPLQALVAQYGVTGGLSVDEIYNRYNQLSPYGQARESMEQVKAGIFVGSPYFNPSGIVIK